MKPRELLFLLPTLQGGGAERVITTLLRHLDRSRFRLTLAVVDSRNPVLRHELPGDVEVIDMESQRVRLALPKIIRLLWTRRPDVVFSTLSHLNLTVAILRPILPPSTQYIAREDSIVSLTISGQPLAALRAILYRLFYRRFDAIVCQSRYMQEDLVVNFRLPRERSVVINNPVDIDRVRLLSQKAVDFARTDASDIIFVAAGRLVYTKGFDLLLAALGILDDERVRLVLLGDGPLRQNLEAQAASLRLLDRIHFVGFQSNPYAWFWRADAFVLSSRYEGFPNVVLEALTCGTPVIALPCPGGTREILDGIPTCVVAQEVAAASLAQAMKHWIDGQRRAPPDDVVDQYSLDRILARYEELLT